MITGGAAFVRPSSTSREVLWRGFVVVVVLSVAVAAGCVAVVVVEVADSECAAVEASGAASGCSRD